MNNGRRAGHQRQNRLLGQNTGGAAYVLYRKLLFKMVQELGRDQCHRCGQEIENYESFSIDHIESWRLADDPKAVFFDLENIAFSHRSCNEYAGAAAQNAAKTHCPQGHEYTEDNTYRYGNGRYCRSCSRERMRIKRRELVLA